MNFFPPRLAGALWIAIGATSVIEMLGTLVEGRFSVDLGFAFIPLGFWLLAGNALARKWALFLALGVLVCNAGSGGCAAYELWSDGRPLPLCPNDVCAVAERVFGTVFSVYMALVLTRRGNVEWFAEAGRKSAEVKSLAWAAALAGAAVGFFMHMAEWRAHALHERPASFRVRVKPYDAVSGKGLVKLSFGSGDVSPTSDAKTGLPKVHPIYLGGDDGGQYEFHGEAAQPFEVTLHAQGYRDKVITLCGKAEYDIRVPMQPLEDAGAGAGAGAGADAGAGAGADADADAGAGSGAEKQPRAGGGVKE